MIIRPIWGLFFEKGKRLYWLSLLLLIAFALAIGPIIVLKLSDKYGNIGLFFGVIIYIFGIWLISRPGIKKENEMNG